jgi:CRISPR-associated protein Cmr2
LFNNGNHLEWVCPWDLLEQGLLMKYRDRAQVTNGQGNWTHFYNDVAVLEARHAFTDQSSDVALALFDIYFPEAVGILDTPQLWNQYQDKDKEKTLLYTGILGDQDIFGKSGGTDPIEINQALNDWIVNLAKVGFHLCQ